GKKTLMVIHAAENAPAADVARLEEILWAEDNTETEILEAIDILQDSGSIDFARTRAKRLAREARESLAAVDLAGEPAEQLADFTEFVIEREV
ncbi:MAG: polyprenyl synthetase family protein, partial [Halapricum sp.]